MSETKMSRVNRVQRQTTISDHQNCPVLSCLKGERLCPEKGRIEPTAGGEEDTSVGGAEVVIKETRALFSLALVALS